MPLLQISIDSGDQTCASAPGKFCQFFGSIKFGQIPVCRLFPDQESNGTQESYTILEDNTNSGWTKKCQACLDASN